MIFKEINTKTRPFLTIRDIENKWIWMSTKHVINVSKKEHDENVVNAIYNHGATYSWIPFGEHEELDIHKICKAMKVLLSYNGEETIIHCDLGNNRSRLVCEFALFAINRKWMVDELSTGLDGCINKTFFNIKRGYLPEIEKVVLLQFS